MTGIEQNDVQPAPEIVLTPTDIALIQTEIQYIKKNLDILTEVIAEGGSREELEAFGTQLGIDFKEQADRMVLLQQRLANCGHEKIENNDDEYADEEYDESKEGEIEQYLVDNAHLLKGFNTTYL